MQSNLPLPLAEKTNIKDWDFYNLNLQEAPAPNIDVSTLVPEGSKNSIVIYDGNILYNQLENGVTTSQPNIDIVKESNTLISLNNKNKNSTININIAKNTKLNQPLYIINVASSRSLLHQTQINIEDGANAEIVETFFTDTKINANIVSKINIGKNAHVTSFLINRINGGSTVYYHKATEVEADATLKSYNFIINNSNVVFEDFTHLVGKGGDANVATVALASGDQKQNITIRVENYAPKSVGNILNYGIVKDSAHLAFNGIGKIHKGMNGVDNQQESRLLNLSRNAEAVANPFLLIDEGDITAGHAASIGQINEEQVYYLMSRGLSKQESEKLIVSGFLTPFVNTVSDENIKKELLNNIEEKLS